MPGRINWVGRGRMRKGMLGEDRFVTYKRFNGGIQWGPQERRGLGMEGWRGK